MNKKILENKIAELLGVSENEKNLAFSLFKGKLSRFLKVGEALRISELGVFQLKEKLDHTDQSRASSKSSPLTLVFSPISDDPSTDSLFVNLDIDKPISDDTTFNENVFQLGIGKPLVTNISNSIDDGNQVKSTTEKIEDSISSILENSEKLDGYDLWEDYLERKETKNLLDEPADADLAIDSIIDESDEEIPNIDLNLLDEDFTPEEEEDLLDDHMQGTNFSNQAELETITNNLKVDDIQIPDPIDGSIENAVIDEMMNNEIEIPDFESEQNSVDPTDELEEESIVENIDEEIEELEDIKKLSFDEIVENAVIDEMNNEIEIPDFESEQNSIAPTEDLKEESIIENIDEEIKELEVMDKLSNEDPIYGDELDELKEGEVYPSGYDKSDEHEEESIVDEINESSYHESVKANSFNDGKINDENQLLKFKEPEFKRTKQKSLILLLLTAFIILGAIGIYFVFFNNSSTVRNEAINEVALSEENDVAETKINKVENSNINNDSKVVNEIKDDEKPIIDNTPLESEEIPLNTTSEESEVSDNIYFDGFVYNVQVSSWRQESIAENEVTKFVKKGFPAYKVEVYIPKFKGTWYRVRIGPFTSLVEAQETKQKVNK